MSSKIVSHYEHFFAFPRALLGSKTRAPKDFGKVAVLMGGDSAEREVSLESGKNVLKALLNQGVDAHAIDATGNFVEKLIQGNYDRVFIILHGKHGEDGRVQGALDSIGLPYTGSGVAASALAMDKPRAKLIFSGLGLSTPPFGIAYNLMQAQVIAKEIGLPLAVKPVAEGSSIGTSKVDDMNDLQKAFEDAHQFGEVLLEPWISGHDIFVTVLGDEVFPSVQVQPQDKFYDYQAKYKSDATQYFCPSPISADKELEVRDMAKKAFYALGCRGWGRVDFVHDEHGNFWVLEVNTIPGMTHHSLVPMSAREVGIDFEQLCLLILATSFAEEMQADTDSQQSKQASTR